MHACTQWQGLQFTHACAHVYWCMSVYACSCYIYKTFPHIVNDYLFNKETTKSGLKRKREPENIVGMKKSKKRLRRL